MSTPAQIAANTINEQSSTGARTEAGHAASSKNATTDSQPNGPVLSPLDDRRQIDTAGQGPFTQRDFIRPGEEETYAQAKADLAAELAPSGTLECNLVNEIHRAMWRLRRCGQVEANLIVRLDDGRGYIFDPMETADAANEKIQQSVDRARNQAHRLLHKCTAELRKLQTERQYRSESLPAGTDISNLGICDVQSIRKGLDRQFKALTKSGSNCKTDSHTPGVAQSVTRKAA